MSLWAVGMSSLPGLVVGAGPSVHLQPTRVPAVAAARGLARRHAEEVVAVAGAASVQELLTRARAEVVVVSRHLASARPRRRLLAARRPRGPRRGGHLDARTRGLALAQCHEVVAVSAAASECELFARGRGRVVVPPWEAGGRT